MAKMRAQYRTTQITTACQVMPDQIAPKQERCTRMKAIDDGYMMSSWPYRRSRPEPLCPDGYLQGFSDRSWEQAFFVGSGSCRSMAPSAKARKSASDPAGVTRAFSLYHSLGADPHRSSCRDGNLCRPPAPQGSYSTGNPGQNAARRPCAGTLGRISSPGESRVLAGKLVVTARPGCVRFPPGTMGSQGGFSQ
jgi:hypothetical protein